MRETDRMAVVKERFVLLAFWNNKLIDESRVILHTGVHRSQTERLGGVHPWVTYQIT